MFCSYDTRSKSTFIYYKVVIPNYGKRLADNSSLIYNKLPHKIKKCCMNNEIQDPD